MSMRSEANFLGVAPADGTGGGYIKIQINTKLKMILYHSVG
jgi:hypothetical protein